VEIRDRLPEHPVPGAVHSRAARSRVRIDGLVAHELLVDSTELTALPRVTIEEPFVCEEGWKVPGLRWGGVILAGVLELAQPLNAARFVCVHSGDYSIAVPLQQAAEVVLSDTLDGLPLPVGHGGPWRLVVPGGQCFSSVKWVDRLEVTQREPATTGERIARNRIRGDSQAGLQPGR